MIYDVVVDLRAGSPTERRGRPLPARWRAPGPPPPPDRRRPRLPGASPTTPSCSTSTSTEHAPARDTGVRFDSVGVDWPHRAAGRERARRWSAAPRRLRIALRLDRRAIGRTVPVTGRAGPAHRGHRVRRPPPGPRAWSPTDAEVVALGRARLERLDDAAGVLTVPRSRRPTTRRSRPPSATHRPDVCVHLATQLRRQPARPTTSAPSSRPTSCSAPRLAEALPGRRRRAARRHRDASGSTSAARPTPRANLYAATKQALADLLVDLRRARRASRSARSPSPTPTAPTTTAPAGPAPGGRHGHRRGAADGRRDAAGSTSCTSTTWSRAFSWSSTASPTRPTRSGPGTGRLDGSAVTSGAPVHGPRAGRRRSTGAGAARRGVAARVSGRSTATRGARDPPLPGTLVTDGLPRRWPASPGRPARDDGPAAADPTGGAIRLLAPAGP